MRVLVEAVARLPRPRASAWADLAVRAASALVLLPLVLGCLWLGVAFWGVLIVGGTGILLAEWRAMRRAGGLGLGAFAAGCAYVGVAALSLWWLRTAGRGEVLFLLMVVWATDIGAYLAGRTFGGRRLAPGISPGKTWSGAVGGTLAGVLAGVGFALFEGGGVAGAALLALVLGVASEIGDLGESAAKRRCGVKDSGRLIPGHGGLFDRVDGVLLAAPLMAALCFWLGPDVLLWK